jgi:hypothetical protein
MHFICIMYSILMCVSRTWSMDLVAPVLVDILVDTVHKTLMNVVVSHVRMEEHV